MESDIKNIQDKLDSYEGLIESTRKIREEDMPKVMDRMTNLIIEFNKNTRAYLESQDKKLVNVLDENPENIIEQIEVGDSILKICTKSSESSLISTIKIAEQTLLYIVVIFSLILGTTIAVLLTKSIIKPIVRVVDELANGSEQVFNTSEQLSLASQELADGSSEQASSIEETSSMVKQNTENNKKAADLTQQAREMSLEGNEQMKVMMNAMDDIKNSSNEIAKIIKVIDDIAFQTNMLALNAAVEAARAGEAGMGFAVVAEEVRILAQRSTQAAKDTSEMIKNSINKSEKGVDIAAKVAKFLENIYNQSEQINEIVKEITTASQEQTQGVIQISKAVSQMEQVTQSIASNAEESAPASEQLNAQDENMKQIVGDLNFFIYAIHRRHHSLKNKSTGIKSSDKKSIEVRAEDVISLEDDPLDF
jgi:methyl-accepting chemotaxis protein